MFISYGPQSHGSLLQYYAFTEANNPNDLYTWSASLDAAAGQAVVQLCINAKGSFTAECQQAARAALGSGGGEAAVDDGALRRALLAAAEQELASRPSSLADDERLLQVCLRVGCTAVCQC